MTRIHRWTEDEICREPEFGNGNGWFYGLVVDERRVRLAEILPGIGWTSPWWQDLVRHPRWVIRDLRHQRPRPRPFSVFWNTNTVSTTTPARMIVTYPVDGEGTEG